MTDADRRLALGALGWAAAWGAAVGAHAAGGDLVALLAAAPVVVLVARVCGRGTAVVVAGATAGAFVPVVARDTAPGPLAAAAGLLVLTAAVAATTPRPSELERRQEVARDLRRLRAVLAEPSSLATGLAETLHLRDCWFEPGPLPEDLPVLGPDGEVDARVQRRVGAGLVLPTVALPAAGGHFVLVGNPEIGVPLEARLVAVAMAATTVPHAAPRRLPG